MTLDRLANALRGMPRDAPMVVRLPDGGLRAIALVRPVLLSGGGAEMSVRVPGCPRKPLICGEKWWAIVGLNHWPSPCQGEGLQR